MNVTPTEIAIYGAGGVARSVAWTIERCAEEGHQCRVVCFVDDDEANQGSLLYGTPVTSLSEARSAFPNARLVVGVGSPQVRRRMAERAASAGFAFATVVHPRVERSRWVEMGCGTVILAGTSLTTNILLGRHVHVYLNCTIGHDSVIGDYCTLASGVHVSGSVRLGEGVFVGTGAVFVNGTPRRPLTIGDNAVVGAGAVVVEDVPADVTVAGVPARIIKRGTTGWFGQ